MGKTDNPRPCEGRDTGFNSQVGRMYYCFNENCNLWGEVVPVAVVLLWPAAGLLPHSCPECGGHLYFHDAWDGNHRIHDDGTPVILPR